MNKTDLNLMFRSWYYSNPACEISDLKQKVKAAMQWTNNQLKERLNGRTVVKSTDIELLCIKLELDKAKCFPGFQSSEK